MHACRKDTFVRIALTILAGAGHDTVTGGSGDDVIDGGPGVDVLRGGDGDDLIMAGAGIGDELQGGAGNDRLFGSDEGAETDPDFEDTTRFGDVLDGGAGDDRIWGLGGADLIAGGDDKDVIDGGAGNDLIRGGLGDDEIFAGAGLSDQLHGDAGNDVIYGSHEGNDLITGGSGNDRLFGQGGDDAIDGGDDHDFLDGGPGTDDLHGGPGDDELLGGGGAGDRLQGDAGDDILRGSDDGPDLMSGGSGRDRLLGGGGNDVLEGGPDDDILDGGPGDDVLSGDAGSDLLVGGADHDVLYALNTAGTGADGAVDYLYGDFGTNGDEPGSGRDQLFGSSGIDRLFGEAGDDLIDDDLAVPGVPDPAATLDLIDYGSGEGADPTAFVPPPATPNPPMDPVGEGLSHAAATLPSGVDDYGRWGELAGSATGPGLSGDEGLSLAPRIAITSAGPVVAWSDTRNGNLEVYVAQHDAGGWHELAGSAGAGGVSRSLTPSHSPSVAVDDADRPLVAWTEVHAGGSDVYVAVYDASAGGGSGAWVPLGSSLGGGGISHTGAADEALILYTSFGPVVAWLDEVAGTRQVYARVFADGSWQELGSSGASGNGISAAPAGSDIRDLTIAARNGRIALAWSQMRAGLRQIYLKEFAGTAWNPVADSASGGGVSAGIGAEFDGVTTHNAEPTVAYLGTDLFVAWPTFSDQESAVVAVQYDGSPAQPVFRGAFENRGLPAQPRLVSGGGELQLIWLHKPLTAQPTRLYALRWNGAAFVEDLPGDGQDAGVSYTSGAAQSLSAAMGADGSASVAWQDAINGTPEVLVRSHRHDISGSVYVAVAGGFSVEQILTANDLEAGDAILVFGPVMGDFTVTAADAGVAIVGAPGSVVIGDVLVTGDDVILQRLTVAGDVTVRGSDRAALRESTIQGTVTVRGGRDVQLSHNTIVAGSPGIVLAGNTRAAEVRSNTVRGGDVGIALGDPSGTLAGGAVDLRLHHNATDAGATGLRIAVPSSGTLCDNDIAATTTGVDLQAAFSGPIRSNRIHGADVGVRYDVAAQLGENEIFLNATGVIATVDSTTDGFGFVPGALANEIYDNDTGVQLTGRMRGQHVFHNTIGVRGSGALGDDVLDGANLIEANRIGVSNFQGTIQFNRIAGNEIGVEASSNGTIWHNLFYANTMAGVRATGKTGVRIVGNTFHSTAGDNIRLMSGSSEVEVLNNILWSEGDYDIYVSNDSQSGYFSDYNDLYASGSGKLVHWILAADGEVLDFDDILDWQEDVHRYDLHSIGRTAVDPPRWEPRFLNRHHDDYRVFELVAGQRFSSPTLGAADPLTVLDLDTRYANQLANAGFESGLTGWTTHGDAATKAGSPAPYEGETCFYAGSAAVGFAEQTIVLSAVGYPPAVVDQRDLTVSFGGRVRSASEAVPDEGEIRVTFLDGSDAVIGQAIVTAQNTDDRWELVGDRVAIPQGTRKLVYRFTADRISGTTNDSFLDAAFLYVVPEDVALAQGAYGDRGLSQPAAAPRIALRHPDLYVDFRRDIPGIIRWDTVGNTADLPVRIDLYQDGPHGPELLLNIADVTDDDGQFAWTPADDLIAYGTYGLRIQVSLVGRAITYDRSSESFTVPEDGNEFYVNVRGDTDLGDNQYTTAAGDNRQTGKRPGLPKPYPNNVLRIYSLQAAQTLFTDTGSYALFDPTVISHVVGIGDDEGFVWTGPTEAGRTAALWHAHPATVAPLVELNDADQVTIRYLTLDNAQRGLWLHNDSTRFFAEYLSVSDHDLDGIFIESNAEDTELHSITANNNRRHGIYATSPLAAIADSRADRNAGAGIYLTGQEGLFLDGNAVSHNVADGIHFEGVAGDPSTISGNLVRGNARGIYVTTSATAAPVTVRENLVTANDQNGIEGYRRVTVTWNSVSDHAGTGILLSDGAVATENVVSGNAVGIRLGAAYSSGSASYNRVYGNTSQGILAYCDSDLLGNVVYSNGQGIAALSWGNDYTGRIANNLVYANSGGVLIDNATDPEVFNNTLHQDTGTALRIQNATVGANLRNNIFWIVDGQGISVSNNSQTRFQSDYNLVHVTGSGLVGLWQDVGRLRLLDWQTAAASDSHSLDRDPRFADADGADGVLGYANPLDDGRDDDFHLQSDAGRFTGALAPVRDAVTGLPVYLPVTEWTDAVRSPAIDRGDPAFGFGNEPLPNGGFVNLGVYGNTVLGSKSPAQYVLVAKPDGGEVWPANRTFDVRWRSDILESGPTGTQVDIALVRDSDPGFSWPVADDVLNSGTYAWTIPDTIEPHDDYRIRITRTDAPALTDQSDGAFSITAPISVYYVNRAEDADFTDNEYTSAAGNNGNSGLAPDQPKASIAAVLQAYSLGPGDVILVEGGTYLLSGNITVDADDAGVAIVGAREHDTVLHRNNTSSSSYVFQLTNADGLTLDSLVLTGGYYGIYANDTSDSDGVTVQDCRIYGNTREEIYLRATNDNVTLAGNDVYDAGGSSYAGVYLEGSGGRVEGNWIHGHATGIDVTGRGYVIAGNTVYDNYYRGIWFHVTGDTGSVIADNRVYANETGISADASSASPWLEIRDNRVFDNRYGISAYYNARVTGNTAYRQTYFGIGVQNGAVASGNVAYDNEDGIVVGGSYSTAVGRDNRAYRNRAAGIRAYHGSQVEGNLCYSNSIGLAAVGGGVAFFGRLAGNIAYDNATSGVLVSNAQPGAVVANNSIYQPAGTGVRFRAARPAWISATTSCGSSRPRPSPSAATARTASSPTSI
jgi:Ca2+-binding RTX toxin-like protein